MININNRKAQALLVIGGEDGSSTARFDASLDAVVQGGLTMGIGLRSAHSLELCLCWRWAVFSPLSVKYQLTGSSRRLRGGPLSTPILRWGGVHAPRAHPAQAFGGSEWPCDAIHAIRGSVVFREAPRCVRRLCGILTKRLFQFGPDL